jgi:hypothetical protein
MQPSQELSTYLPSAIITWKIENKNNINREYDYLQSCCLPPRASNLKCKRETGNITGVASPASHVPEQKPILRNDLCVALLPRDRISSSEKYFLQHFLLPGFRLERFKQF